MIRVVMIGFAGVIMALLFQQQRREYALYISLGTALLILGFSVEKLGAVMDTIRQIQDYLGVDSSMIRVLLKMIGITYVAEFATQICGDAGYGTLGKQIEVFAKLSIMAVSVPVLLALIETVEGLMGV
ncbi:MAG: stage III sporulation protein AD [Lachnospiraceae bacterium]|nr:stage III sporulation protein AD [Lachnospiraceae bacterium]